MPISVYALYLFLIYFTPSLVQDVTCNRILTLSNNLGPVRITTDTFDLTGFLVCDGPKRLIIDFYNFEKADRLEVKVFRENGIVDSLITDYIGSDEFPITGEEILHDFRDYTLFYNGDPGVRVRSVPPANFSLPHSFDPDLGMGRITLLTVHDSMQLVVHFHPTAESNIAMNIICDNEFEVLRVDTTYVCEIPQDSLLYQIVANCDTVYERFLFVGQTIAPDTLYIEDDNLASDTIANGYINFFGCEITDTILIFIPEPVPPEPTKKEIYVPNVFSPNWDGVNDVWTIDSATHILVVDRRNNRMFSCDSDTDCAEGWGPYLPKIPAGVYIFYARVRHRGQIVQLRGDVTLVR